MDQNLTACIVLSDTQICSLAPMSSGLELPFAWYSSFGVGNSFSWYPQPHAHTHNKVKDL